MGKTIVEKILSRVKGQEISAGYEGLFTPDMVAFYDFPGGAYDYGKHLKTFNMDSIKTPEKYHGFIDHFNPAGNSVNRSVHDRTRLFAKEYGVNLHEGKGIGHQVVVELGLIKPGQFAVHHDFHTSIWGALNAVAFGFRSNILESFATDQQALVVPDTVRINFTGKLSKGVTGRDVFQTIVKILGQNGCLNQVVEFGGDGLKSVCLDDRLTICSLTMFLGAVTSVMEADEIVDNYVRARTNDAITPVFPDKDARYAKELTVRLEDVVPILAAPGSPANTIDISEAEGLKVDVAYAGSCGGGRLTDFARILEILNGKPLHEYFELYAVPSSVQIQKDMASNGMMGRLIDCGAMMYYPSCDFCFGQLGVLTDGKVALSTGPLNVPGRMGNLNSDIYLSSAYIIGASALTGKITDPRKIL